MGKIKTRETVKNVKAIDKAAIAGERMKNAFIRSKDGTENLMDDRQVTPSEYAEDKVLYAAEDISHDAAHLAGSGIKTAANKGKEAFQRQQAEKAAEKLREHSSAPEPPASEQPSPAEHWQTPSSVQTDTPNVTPAEQSKVPVTERPLIPQTRPVRQGYQPVSTGDSGATLYSDADRMAEQGRELAKKKTKQKAEVGRQIKQQTDKIAHQPERTVKTTDVSSGTRQAVETVRAAERPAQFTGKSVQIADKSVQGVKSSARRVEQSTRTAKQTTQAAKQSVRTVERSARSIKQTAKSTGRATAKTAKGTIKTSQRAVKTAQQTSKAAIKTSQVAAKATQKTAQDTAKAARAAAAAAKAAAKAAVVTAKAVAKATAATVKAIIAGVKALIAAIAAGGWVAVLVIVIICLIALIVGSCFGIFFSSEDTGSEQTMYEVVREINTDYDDQLERTKQSYVYDDLEMYGSRAVWKEVLSVYAVKTTTDPNNAQEVASMDDGKKALLKEIFWAMNVIDARTDTFQTTEYTDTVDGNGNIVQEQTTVTKTVLYITVSHKSADEMAVEYGFNADQRERLAALLAEENNSMWSAVLYGIGPGDNEIVTVALSQIGNVGGMPYWSWYGFDYHVEWCACFVSWCANECGYIENGIIPQFAWCPSGAAWFRERGLWQDGSYEPRPGDIIFFDWDDSDTDGQDGEADHVGIVERVENGYVYTVEGNSGDSCRQKSYAVGYYEILGYGTPAY